MRRCFIAINIDEEIKKEIMKIQKQLPDFTGKKTEPKNIHLTLKFLGEISDEKLKIVREKLRETKFPIFFLSLNKLGFFSEKILKILWLGVDFNCKEIFNLQKFIDDKMSEIGFSKEKRFMGHLTIARIKNVENRKKFFEDFGKIKPTELKFEVKKFFLIESELKPGKPIYKIIEEFKLEENI